MATCPECRARFDDEVESCPQHGAALVPDALLLPEDAPLEQGTMVGEYQIHGKLGAGTFGDVYAGEQPVIGKRVAIKVLNRRFASDPVMVSRFVAEARAVNKIRQRNIIDIFSFGVLPGLDRHYFVMELLDGMTLGELLDRTGRLPIAHVLPIVRGIADALDAVHESGITHRDLKPDNVFLARERDGSYFPKLLDFGIAKLLGEDVAHKTGSGMVLGTPRYMSPEQARGKKADHRSDIYALGVMIHEMLTGSPLFEGDSAVDMLLKQAVEDPRPPSEVCPDLPPGLDAPILDMLRKRPADRPASAGKAVAGLAACAKRLGLDHSDLTLAELAADGTTTREAVPKFTGTTVTVDRAAVSAPATVKRVPPPASGDRPRAADPMSKTERAPASGPAADATLASRAATPVASDPVQERGPTTESVSTLETSSALRRMTRTRRLRVAVGTVMAAALAIALWGLGHRGPSLTMGETSKPPPQAIAGGTSAPVEPPRAQPGAAAGGPTPQAPPEPTVKPEATVPVAAAADAGAHVGGDPQPPAAGVKPAMSARPSTKPPPGGRNLDRLLGDR